MKVFRLSIVFLSMLLFLTGCSAIETEEVKLRLQKKTFFPLERYKQVVVYEYNDVDKGVLDTSVYETLNKLNLPYHLISLKESDLNKKIVENITVEATEKDIKNIENLAGELKRKLPDIDLDVTALLITYSYSEELVSSTTKTFNNNRSPGTVHVSGRFFPGSSTSTTYRVTAKLFSSFKLIDFKNKTITEKEFYEKTQRSSPDQGTLQFDNIFRSFYKQNISKFQKACSDFEEDVKIEFIVDKKLPNLAAGIKYIKQNNWEKGIELFEKQIEEYDKLPDQNVDIVKAYYNLILAYNCTNQYDKEKQMRIKVSKMYPELYEKYFR